MRSPCTGYMRNASAVSVSLISASSCGLPTNSQLDAAAYALVTAASKDGCSFSSAISSVSLAGGEHLRWCEVVQGFGCKYGYVEHQHVSVCVLML